MSDARSRRRQTWLRAWHDCYRAEMRTIKEDNPGLTFQELELMALGMVTHVLLETAVRHPEWAVAWARFVSAGDDDDMRQAAAGWQSRLPAPPMVAS